MADKDARGALAAGPGGQMPPPLPGPAGPRREGEELANPGPAQVQEPPTTSGSASGSVRAFAQASDQPQPQWQPSAGHSGDGVVTNLHQASEDQGGSGTANGNALAGLQRLLKIEAEVRSVQSVPEFKQLVVNECRKLVRARQVLYFSSHGVIAANAPTRHANLKLEAVSSVVSHDRNAPLMQAFEHVLKCIARAHGLGEVRAFTFAATVEKPGMAQIAEAYPMQELAWVPLNSRDGTRCLGGLLLAREIPWADVDLVIAKRFAATSAHAWQALEPKLAQRQRGARRSVIAGVFTGTVLLALAIPVPMSALAPFEIVARDPVIVAAPLDGVIEAIPVRPNTAVREGTVLVQFADTTLSSRSELAEREVRVAEARLKRANQMAFASAEGRRELAIARAERDVRISERAYARELLERATVRAEKAAIVVFNNRNELIGRPVKTGERLMELADPKQVQAQLDVPVADGAILKVDADVRLFLDSDPLRPLSAKVVLADYRAKPHQGERVSFRARAYLQLDPDDDIPRLGVRGTAQVYGPTVPLGVYLFRRPVSAARQWLGL